MDLMILSRDDVKHVLKMQDVIEGVSDVYRLKTEGQTAVWPYIAHHFEQPKGVMDIKSGYVRGKKVHGLKMLNNFPGNIEKHLPHFNGLLMVFDSETGLPQGVLDATYITCMRTGAAGALGAKLLANEKADTLLMVGAGTQALYLIAASLHLMPHIKKITIADPMLRENAERMVATLPQKLKDEFSLDAKNILFIVADLNEESVRNSQIILTATPSRTPLIKKEWVQPGTHFSCIGADMEGKEEIDPNIFSGAIIYADDINQCINAGEMEIPVKTGIINKTDIAGEIGEVIEGTKPGRKNDRDITIFDATGLALLDLVVGKSVIQLAHQHKIGKIADI